MAFNVNLYSFSKEVNSTKQPTGSGTEYSCVSNDDLDTLHPRIPLNIGAAANPSAYNYMYIASFSRYYWIRKWTFETGLWVAYCDVDPLASWKSQIGSTSAYVLRAAAASNGAIIDNLYPKTSTILKENDIGNALWNTDPLTSGSYVVGVIGQSTVKYYTMTPSTLWAFMNDCYSPQYYTDTLGFFSLTNQDLMIAVDPLQYIASVVWLPFTADTGTTASTLKVGVVDIVSINGIIYKNMASAGFSSMTVDFTPQSHPQAATRGTWLNSAMADYSITVPPFGTISLDPVQVANADTIHCVITIDHRTGAGVLKVFAQRTYDYDILLTQMTAQIGLSFPLSHITTPGASLASVVLPAIQAAGGVASMAAGAVTGTPGAMIGGAGSVLSAAASAIGDIAQTKIPVPTTTGGTPCVAQLIMAPQMDYTWYYPVDEDNTHRGRPLCEVRTLSTLSGYQLCANTDISIPATREEIDMIRKYLETGYFYE